MMMPRTPGGFNKENGFVKIFLQNQILALDSGGLWTAGPRMKPRSEEHPDERAATQGCAPTHISLPANRKASEGWRQNSMKRQPETKSALLRTRNTCAPNGSFGAPDITTCEGTHACFH